VIAPAGRKLGKYEILRKLGRGGMADVYLAQDTERGHTVALKLIEHSADQDTRDALDAERRGAELQARLAEVDPRVARIFDAGDLDGFFFVAMEYVDGEDLAERMHGGPLPPEFAADVAVAVAETLENAHHLEVSIEGKNFQGIVHGDIKPKNIRIDSREQVRVLDFGIAKALSLSRRLTRNEFGSVPYASPERLESGEVSAQSDLWSLAVMVYEMATGLQPYHAPNTERLERMIRSRIPPPPPPDPCPEPLRRILIKAMAPEPELRYQSAREFADDLIAWRLGAPVKAAAEDLDATRRTFHRDRDETRRTAPDDATRRTAAQAVAAGAPQKPPRPKSFRRAARVLAALVLACTLYVVWSIGSDYFLYKRGAQLERDIQSEQLTDIDQIWNRWTELSKSNPSSFFLRGPRKVVKQKLVDAADRTIGSYRDGDVVYENDWKAARAGLARALALDPDDSVRGKLRIAEGHLARINGTAHRDTQQYNLAVAKFTEAERLLPKSPDPELGLARVYVYGLKDIDRADDQLQQAEKRGYRLGNREKLQLADGYRERADRLWWDSRNVRGLPQEKEQIERARQDYQRAMDLYQQIAPYGNASSAVARVQASLDSVNSRLEQIDAGQASGDPTAARGIVGEVLRRVEGAIQKAAGGKDKAPATAPVH
jgi:serine/threonine protein kinase/tetratricopeptide (TPR) repeat protein